MSDIKKELLESKGRYSRSKGDVRFLHKAIIKIIHHEMDKYERNDIEWIFKAMEKEFKGKSKTNKKNERIGALVAHIVSNGGDVLMTLEVVAEWLRLSKTKVRNAYYRLVKILEIDPKIEDPMEDWEFRIFYGRIPLEYFREYNEENRPFPERPDLERVHTAMMQAVEKSFKFEQEGFQIEMNLYRLMFGDDWVDETLQKKSA